MKKKKIINIIIHIILIMCIFTATDAIVLKLFHSENWWLELGIYLMLCTIVFGCKSGISILWNKLKSKQKENSNFINDGGLYEKQ